MTSKPNLLNTEYQFNSGLPEKEIVKKKFKLHFGSIVVSICLNHIKFYQIDFNADCGRNCI